MSFTTVRPGSAWTSEHCSLRVVRDGSWIDDPRSLRSACKAFEKVYFRKDGSRVPVLVGAATFGGRRDQGVAFWRLAFPQTPYLVVTAEEDLAASLQRQDGAKKQRYEWLGVRKCDYQEHGRRRVADNVRSYA
jgi:hypothetical protein